MVDMVSVAALAADMATVADRALVVAIAAALRAAIAVALPADIGVALLAT
jgi:hypothetical protein